MRAKLAKLGIHSRFDLVLHLPLRYEDETKLTPLADAGTGEPVLVEAQVVECEVKYRPRRTLVVKCSDGRSELWLRFLNFYPSQVKQMAPGRRLRLFGEVRPGFFGAEMVHPKVRVVEEGAPLPASLTPVYPTTAGMPQPNLRGFIEHALDTLLMDDTLERRRRHDRRAQRRKQLRACAEHLPGRFPAGRSAVIHRGDLVRVGAHATVRQLKYEHPHCIPLRSIEARKHRRGVLAHLHHQRACLLKN